MARKRGPNEPSTYQTQPEIPSSVKSRYELICAILGGQTTISDGAEQLQIKRVNMQAVVHRVQTAIVMALAPRPTGPLPKPAREKELEAKLAQLEKENAKLKRQLQAADDMMGAAGEIIRHLRGLPPATSRTSSSRSKRSPQKPPSSDDDPERAPNQAVLQRALSQMRNRDVKTRSARLLGLDPATLERWITRLANNEPLRRRRGGVMHAGPPESQTQVRELIVELRGLAGAASLARSVTGVSRRRAAQLKQETLAELERVRKASCARVEVMEPGVVRGFDAMHLAMGYALVAADACVPYRTSILYVPTYDAEHVAAILATDFATHGAPLVLRCDCARCHTAPPVMSVLEDYGVTLLQGPPYHAQYYGQLERQNREHDDWLRWIARTSDDMQRELDRMKTALSERWLRPTLGWRTAAQCWEPRRSFDHERSSFLDDVRGLAALLRDRDVEDHLATRLAIEQALTQRGHLKITPGRTTLCE